eukprot:scaffold159598_cov30-Tisochrysis_lutea.AAC.2
MVEIGPSPACTIVSLLPNHPREETTSWPAIPPVTVVRRTSKSGSMSATARTGRWYHCVELSPFRMSKTTTVPSYGMGGALDVGFGRAPGSHRAGLGSTCEHEPTNSPLASIETQFTAAE